MRGFFKVQSVAQFTAILQGFLPLAHEEVDLVEVEGRILAQDLLSPEDLPQADRSVMDGFAVRAQDTFGSGESNPAYLELSADLDITVNPDQELQPGQCMAIVTGGCLPPGADAVVMIEHTADMGGGTMEIRKSVAPGDNIMEQGEDAQQGKLALAAGTLLRPQEIGFLAALGQERAVVHKQPRVGILSTGDELVEVGAEVRPGLVRDVNSHTLQALARRAGAKATRLGMVRDEESELRQALEDALLGHDVVLLSGGSSVGVRDLTLDVIQALDSPDTPVELLAHGVAVSPGKPLILATVGGKAVWGLPGQVTSAQVVMQVFVQPFIRLLLGDAKAFDRKRRVTIRAVLSRNLPSKQGREDYVRARLEHGEQGGLPRAVPVLGRSGLLRTMLQAEGLIRIPEESEGLYQDTELDFWLMGH